MHRPTCSGLGCTAAACLSSGLQGNDFLCDLNLRQNAAQLIRRPCHFCWCAARDHVAAERSTCEKMLKLATGFKLTCLGVRDLTVLDWNAGYCRQGLLRTCQSTGGSQFQQGSALNYSWAGHPAVPSLVVELPWQQVNPFVLETLDVSENHFAEATCLHRSVPQK